MTTLPEEEEATNAIPPLSLMRGNAVRAFFEIDATMHRDITNGNEIVS
jgi:hypothetical protein